MNLQRPVFALACLTLAASATAQHYEPVEEVIPVTEEGLQSGQIKQIEIVDEVPDNEYYTIGVVSEEVVNEQGRIDLKLIENYTNDVIAVPAEGACPSGSGDKIYDVVEQQACFPGGQSAMSRWISANLRYPEQAQKSCIEGRVAVKFVVNKDGTVTNPTILRGVDKDLDKEAIRLVRRMPKWNPARHHGEPVSSYFVLPVTFKLLK